MRLLVLLLLANVPGCYQAHLRAEGERDAGTTRDAAVDAQSDGGRLCGCPGSVTARVCALPLMCCPVTRTCEDPARFNCTGSAPPCD